MSANNGRFTRIEKRMLAILSDGLPHRREELQTCLYDDQGPVQNIHPHISHIRAKILSKGETIVCEFVQRRINYRHVRLLHSPTKD